MKNEKRAYFCDVRLVYETEEDRDLSLKFLDLASRQERKDGALSFVYFEKLATGKCIVGEKEGEE